MKASAIVLGLALFCAPLPGVGQSKLNLDGLYLFHTIDQTNGAPTCSEAWIFGADGTMQVESGAERISKHYKLEPDSAGAWLVSEMVATNGRPDCQGTVNAEVVRGERRVYLAPLNDGRMATCPAPQKTADGAPVIRDCFGWLVLGSKAG